MFNKYTEDELINELLRFEIENNKVPTKRDMNNAAGYISQNVYYKFFGSFDIALQKAGMKLNRGYINKEFLIAELQRFVLENGRNPISTEFLNNSEFPSHISYARYFGSWNKGLIAAGLEINKINEQLTGFETCSLCGKSKPSNQGWIIHEGKRYCNACHRNNGYRKGKLNPSTSTGLAFISQRVVMIVLQLDDKYDCNLEHGFNFRVDIYDEHRYGTINVKSATIFDETSWIFNMRNKNIPDTYICLGFDKERKNIEHIWVVDALDDLVYAKQSFTVTSGINSLNNHKYCEVDAEPYNDAYYSMSLDNCEYLRCD